MPRGARPAGYILPAPSTTMSAFVGTGESTTGGCLSIGHSLLRPTAPCADRCHQHIVPEGTFRRARRHLPGSRWTVAAAAGGQLGQHRLVPQTPGRDLAEPLP